MQCPKCYHTNSRVLDSRPLADADALRTRRERARCGCRCETFERKEETRLITVTKDGTGQEFNRDKLMTGLMRACEKRPVNIEESEHVALAVEQEIRQSESPEISSEEIGEMVLDRLKDIDELAYVRFASVYRQFDNIDFFLDELKEILQSSDSKQG